MNELNLLLILIENNNNLWPANFSAPKVVLILDVLGKDFWDFEFLWSVRTKLYLIKINSSIPKLNHGTHFTENYQHPLDRVR